MNNGYKKPDLKSLYYDNEMEAIPSLNGKTIAITGTTSGTGFIAAKTVAKKGARTLLLHRKSDRSESSFNQIRRLAQEQIFLMWNVICKVLNQLKKQQIQLLIYVKMVLMYFVIMQE